MITTRLSYIERLIDEIDNLTPIVDTLMDNSSIFYHDPSRTNYIYLGNKYRWTKKDERLQLILKDKYLKFYESFALLLKKAHPQTQKKAEKSNKEIINLIEQNDAPRSTEAGKSEFRDQIKVFKDFLHLLSTDDKLILIVPDTNSIIEFPEPMSYCKLASSNKFQFIILPTILSELDKLKVVHRDNAFREKVKSVIKRLKGYRNQGNVLEGVIVDKTIIVKMIAIEPSFQNTLRWLDSENNDDRIIANALELQIQSPSHIVVLVTSDINLQNKALLANLSFHDTDEIEV